MNTLTYTELHQVNKHNLVMCDEIIILFEKFSRHYNEFKIEINCILFSVCWGAA